MTKYKLYDLNTNKKIGRMNYHYRPKSNSIELILGGKNFKDFIKLVKSFLKKKKIIIISGYWSNRKHNRSKKYQKSKTFDIYAKKMNGITQRIYFEKQR